MTIQLWFMCYSLLFMAACLVFAWLVSEKPKKGN